MKESDLKSRVVWIDFLRVLGANIAENLGEGTAEELVEYALGEGREPWGIDLEIDQHDRELLVKFTREAMD